MYNYFEIKDKIVLITGASRGLGRNFALEVAKQGAIVVGVATNETLLNNLKKEIETNGGRCEIIKTDISNENEIIAMAEGTKEKFGRIDVLINNAGIHRRGLMTDLTKDDWEAVIGVNIIGMALCIKHVAKVMKENGGGKIINIGSIMSEAGLPMAGIYCSTKGAVRQMTKVAALELAKDNIQVNAIGPGYFETEINDKYLKKPELKQVITDKIPMCRWGESNELIGAALFLSSQASSYVTGQMIFVDGGYLSQ